MEWYLQTRTNTPINYKTILPLQASRPSSTAPKADPRALPHNHRRFHPLSSNPLRSPIDSSTVPPPLPRPPPIYRLSYQRISLSTPRISLSPPPLSTRRRRTFDHPHSRVISRTIVPSSGLRKYLTLESRERKGRGLSTSKQTERMTSSRLR